MSGVGTLQLHCPFTYSVLAVFQLRTLVLTPSDRGFWYGREKAEGRFVCLGQFREWVGVNDETGKTSREPDGLKEWSRKPKRHRRGRRWESWYLRKQRSEVETDRNGNRDLGSHAQDRPRHGHDRRTLYTRLPPKPRIFFPSSINTDDVWMDRVTTQLVARVIPTILTCRSQEEDITLAEGYA